MATQMTDRLDSLYVAANRGTSEMNSSAVSACSRWCTPKTSHAQVEGFVLRQIASLEGLNDSLSCEIRGSWEWLAAEIGPAPVLVAAPKTARVFSLASRRRTVAATVAAGSAFGQGSGLIAA